MSILNTFLHIIFIIGLFYLKKVARSLLSNNYFTTKVILNLKKCGILFLTSGTSYAVLNILFYLWNLYLGKLEVILDSPLTQPFLLIIIGLFLLIQSNDLSKAKGFKEENELTV